MKIAVVLFSFVFCFNAAAKPTHHEKYYQKIKCNELGGIMEYTLPDKTRIDCLTDTYAIEFDFAKKWAESVGQALYYALQTNRRAGVALILENGARDMKYARRLAHIATKYDITVWLIW